MVPEAGCNSRKLHFAVNIIGKGLNGRLAAGQFATAAPATSRCFAVEPLQYKTEALVSV